MRPEPGARACANCPCADSASTPLTPTATVRAEDPGNVPRITLDGIRRPEGSPDGSMPRFGSTLSDDEFRDLMAFIRQRFLTALNDRTSRLPSARRGNIDACHGPIGHLNSASPAKLDCIGKATLVSRILS